jgi:hypothetical protein
MNLSEIITANEDPAKEIEIGQIRPYKKSLLTYYTAQAGRGEQIVLMVTTIFNAAQYGKIVAGSELDEAANAYLNADESLTEEDKETAKETIFFNSIALKNL